MSQTAFWWGNSDIFQSMIRLMFDLHQIWRGTPQASPYNRRVLLQSHIVWFLIRQPLMQRLPTSPHQARNLYRPTCRQPPQSTDHPPMQISLRGKSVSLWLRGHTLFLEPTPQPSTASSHKPKTSLWVLQQCGYDPLVAWSKMQAQKLFSLNPSIRSVDTE